MKTAKKAVLLVLCAILLVVASVLGTLAYLADDAQVENTFTVGMVDIDLYESKVDSYGVVVPGDPVPSTNTNEYLLVPGHTYTKNPTVVVKANSEKCYVFVKVENGIANYETKETTKTIATQIEDLGWVELTAHSGVYYKVCDKQGTDQSLEVFGDFTIATDANHVDGWSDIATNAKVIVTAYAVQFDGMADVAAAWSAAETEAALTP